MYPDPFSHAFLESRGNTALRIELVSWAASFLSSNMSWPSHRLETTFWRKAYRFWISIFDFGSEEPQLTWTLLAILMKVCPGFLKAGSERKCVCVHCSAQSYVAPEQVQYSSPPLAKSFLPSHPLVAFLPLEMLLSYLGCLSAADMLLHFTGQGLHPRWLH